jgi:tRNA threonylcarbamoyl adenosine modification protein YeaZ
MITLACDTAGDCLSVGVLIDGVWHEKKINSEVKRQEALLELIHLVLQEQGRSLADIDLFAFAAGPGSYTGLRIGAACVKALAYAEQKPVMGVNVLDAAAIENDGVAVFSTNSFRKSQYLALYTGTERVSEIKETTEVIDATSLKNIFPDFPFADPLRIVSRDPFLARAVASWANKIFFHKDFYYEKEDLFKQEVQYIRPGV